MPFNIIQTPILTAPFTISCASKIGSEITGRKTMGKTIKILPFQESKAALDSVLHDSDEDRESDNVDALSAVTNGTFLVCDNSDDTSPEGEVVAYTISNSVYIGVANDAVQYHKYSVGKYSLKILIEDGVLDAKLLVLLIAEQFCFWFEK
jgi:hypothetical protein